MEDERIYVYAKNGNFVKSYFEGTQKEIEQQEGQKVFISNIDLGKTAIIENGAARVMTRLDRIKANEEILQEGEYIKDNEIITVERPNNFYFWDPVKKKWIYEKDREIEFLEGKIGDIEISIMNVKKDIEKCKQEVQNFAVKKLQKQLDELIIDHDEKIKKYEELGGNK